MFCLATKKDKGLKQSSMKTQKVGARKHLASRTPTIEINFLVFFSTLQHTREITFIGNELFTIQIFTHFL